MRTLVHFLPIVTTVVAAYFTFLLTRRYLQKGGGPHLAWWAAGGAMYGVGTFTEAYVTLFGWNEWVFRAWYVAGALLGGAPLAQGTVYLLLRRRTAHVLSAILVPVLVAGSVLVFLSPVDAALAEPHRLSGKVLAWSWVRLVSPFVNLYALVFLVGGAALSAWRFRRTETTRHRFVGNVFIAVGALLPGIGGAFTRAGYTEVLYVMELLGLLLILVGYRIVVQEPWVPASSGDARLHVPYYR